MVFVHEQREGEIELVPELLMRFGRVSRHSEDLDFLTLEAIPQVTESAGLGGATGGVVAGIEVEQEAAPLQVGAGYLRTLVVGGCEVGSLFSY